MLMLKGSGFMDILPQRLKTLIDALIMNGLEYGAIKKQCDKI